MQREFTILIAI